MKKISKTVLASLFISLFNCIFLPNQIFAQETKTWTKGACVMEYEGNSGQFQVATIQGLECLIANVLSVAISAIGLVGFLMFIYAGFKYLTAGTNTQNVESAKKAITYSIVGLIVALSSFFIVSMIASFTGINTLLNFKIPNSNMTW